MDYVVEGLGIAAIIGAAGTKLVEYLGSFRDRQSNEAKERAAVIAEYQGLLDLAKKALAESEEKRATQVAALEARVAALEQRMAQRHEDLEAARREILEHSQALSDLEARLAAVTLERDRYRDLWHGHQKEAKQSEQNQTH